MRRRFLLIFLALLAGVVVVLAIIGGVVLALR